MPEIAGIGGEPFGLVEKPLSRPRVDLSQVTDDLGQVCDFEPRHDNGRLPMQAKLLGHFLTG